jgi:serine/threonine protein kinase
MLLEDHYDGRLTDIWAAGISLYYMFFREYPFSGANEMDLYENIQNQE